MSDEIEAVEPAKDDKDEPKVTLDPAVILEVIGGIAEIYEKTKKSDLEEVKERLKYDHAVLDAQIKFAMWFWIFIAALIFTFVGLAAGLMFKLGDIDKGLSIITGLAIGIAGVVLGYSSKVGKK